MVSWQVSFLLGLCSDPSTDRRFLLEHVLLKTCSGKMDCAAQWLLGHDVAEAEMQWKRGEQEARKRREEEERQLAKQKKLIAERWGDPRPRLFRASANPGRPQQVDMDEIGFRSQFECFSPRLWPQVSVPVRQRP